MPMSEPTSEGLLRAVRQMGHEEWYFRPDLFRDDDIWLASYPRSGSHFARFILVSARHFLRYGKFPSDLSGMKAIPDVHGGRLEFAEGPPRILKTHFPFDPRYRRVIHLIRDPRDVIVSYFHYSKGLPHLFSAPVPNGYKLPQFVDLFLRGKVWPGDIREHSASYSKFPDSVTYTCIHYEKLLAEPRLEYLRLLEAAGIDLPAHALDPLIEHTSFASMRRLHRPESARAGLVEGNPEYILRRGVAGQHEQTLRERTRERIELEFGDYLRLYGYF
jgi:hypothetical protein